MTSAVLITEKDDGVATLRLNRPAVLNALDPELLTALLAAIDDIESDPAVRGVVLAGEGRAFCAGGDLTAMLHMQRDSFGHYIGLLQRLSSAVRSSRKPFVAALHGYVLAGGFELALLCDIRLAAADTIFGLPDTPIGLSPTSGLTYLLPRIVGMGWAMHLTLTGERFDVRLAQQIGLVTKVVEVGEVDRHALALVRSLVGYPQPALGYIKQSFGVASSNDLQTALQSEMDNEVACFQTDEVRSNLLAFANRARRSAG
jgi:enoyl-CoA hydratase/carnithine racemase